MEWQQLMGFYETAKTGSFTEAAKKTLRTQSAVSQQIKSLESEFSCSLFEKTGNKGLRLTLAGERLFAFAENVLRQRNELRDDIDAIAMVKRARLRIGGQFASFYYTLPKVVESYIKEFPFVDLVMFECNYYEIISFVRSGKIDFGIFLAPSIPDDLVSIPWKKANVVLITPLNHPLTEEKEITLEKIARFPLLFASKQPQHETITVFENKFIKENIKYRIVMESSTIELGSKYVELGLGISVAPEGFGLDSLKKRKLALTPIGHLFEDEYISVIMRKDKVLQPHKSAFIDLLFEHKKAGEG